MSSLTAFNQAVPNVGVIGSSRRSPTQNPQKLVCINGNGSLESSNSSRSSTSGEEGFISGSSSAEEISHVDQLTSHFDILGIGKSTMNRFNGTNGGGYPSIIDEPAHKIFSSLNNSALFEQSNLREFKDRMKDDSSPLLAAYQQQLSITNQTSFLQQQSANLGFSGLNQTRQPQLPGAWFYENSVDEGLPGSGSASSGLPGECSPIAELNDDYQFASFRAALNNPYTVDEHVEVPSSEHVAEIVGRQGCKIKALRAKTNTYIKTPSRNEPPVFKITGRPEDVVEAKREIECAAEHFTQIRASRRHSQGGIPAPGHVTAYVRVPLRVVGLVVGPKGATIKRIQQDTHTYIITPSREREPIFEVTGLPENVASARREIEQHIYQRTGNMPITDPNTPINDYDLIAAAAAQAAAQAHSNLANRPNYGALATGTHLRRASVVLGASLLSGMQRNTDMINNGTYNEMMRSGMISKPYSASVSPPPPATNNNMFSANSCNSFYSPHDMASMSSSAAAAALLRSASNDYQTGNYQTWTSSGYANNGMQNGNSSAFVQDLFSSANTNAGLNMLSNGFDSLGGNNLCNLNSNKSASRDEGLGESPTVSCGKLNAEPYHLMSSIWSDLEANNIFEKPLDSSSAIQLATS